MPLYPPLTLIANRYRVVSRPLMGGMGVVYLCDDLLEKRPVALKSFRPELLPNREARARFLEEGGHWVALGVHPHVVQCYDVFYEDPTAWLALELVAKDGERQDASLRAWLAPGRPLPVETALLFALQAARGMAHACRKIPGFVHRDLKPENLLVGADRLGGWKANRLRITDFGLVKAAGGAAWSGAPAGEAGSGRQGTLLTQHLAGTPRYMAPEQWQVGAKLSAATDVYALGCILYEMLVGEFAAPGANKSEWERAHCGGRLRALPGGVPEAAAGVLRGCLALEAGARYASWEPVAAALQAALHELGFGAAPGEVSGAALGRSERVRQGWSQIAMGTSYAHMGQAAEAAERYELARQVGRGEGERALEGAALGSLGNAYLQLGDARRAIGCYEQALVILREIGDRRGEGAALGNLGNAYQNLGDARRAIGYYEQRLEIAREIGDRRGEGNSLGNLGLAYADLGDARRAIGFYEQQLVITREIGDRRGEGAALGSLGLAYDNLGEPRRAIEYYEQSLAIKREIGNQQGVANTSWNLGLVYEAQGDFAEAVRLMQVRVDFLRAIGHPQAEKLAARVAAVGKQAHTT
ncbi:MAG: serine/threonine-protein kinase [Chloroflexi bacterium]|nr:serine/threonine-protein kinase [Chloroflexota bacterium]